MKHKYYAFDLDDNILSINSYIYFKNKDDKIVKVPTDKLPKIRNNLDELGYSYFKDSFAEFEPKMDKKFYNDFKKGTPAESMPAFVRCVNNGSIFAIITARGNSPEIIKKAIKWLILNEKYGISLQKLKDSLKMFSSEIEEFENNNTMVNFYLNLCKFYPVNNEKIKEELYVFNNASANTEDIKVKAMRNFISYIKRVYDDISPSLKKMFNEPPAIGFSDDDEGNYHRMKNNFSDENYDNFFSQMYFKKTKGKI